MFAHLPPVGNPVSQSLIDNPVELLGEVFSGRTCHLYGSGTMALAAALKAAVARARGLGLKGDPEVVLPAYACPDLISAAFYAKVKPVLVDFEAERPWMNLDLLRRNLSPRTVAVIAVHFLGIPERLGPIRELLVDREEITLIEDSAQYFPRTATSGYWSGDLIVLSFGRGKPVNLLGGGAVVSQHSPRGENLAEALPLADETALASVNATPSLPWRVKLALYRQVLRPGIYGLLQGLPWLHIGETRYHTLAAITAARKGTTGLLAANIIQYRRRTLWQQDSVAALVHQQASDQVIDLPRICGWKEDQPLLRYPILLSSSRLKRQMLDRLHILGASGMYPTILPDLPGLSSLLAGQGEFPHAARFASRIMTLPTHAGVKSVHISKIAELFNKILQE